jgi:hypothetical protein
MTVKKKYNIGDTVWVYGISHDKSTQGTVVNHFTINYDGWDESKVHYVIAVPTEIEPLLEVRTWETISQDQDGPVGSIREAFADTDAALKILRRTGLTLVQSSDSDYHFKEDEADDPSPEQIHKALIKSQTDVAHAPIVYKDNTKPSRKRYPSRKKKTNAG